MEIPATFCFKYGCFPLEIRDLVGKLKIKMAVMSRFDQDKLREVTERLQSVRYNKVIIEQIVLPENIIWRLIIGCYKIKNINKNILENLLQSAIMAGASDVHIHASRILDLVSIFFRIDGELVSFDCVGNIGYREITNLVKIACNLKWTDLEIQRGYFEKEFLGRMLSFRVSFVPQLERESYRMVIRILDNIKLVKVSNLDFSLKQLEEVKKFLANFKEGIFLIAGVTGSGKTTTMYVLLNFLKKHKHIVTLEDPIEQNISGITQFQNSNKLPFADLLKEAFRQDPDIIAVGEIRDKESASIAEYASRSHPVFATIHSAKLETVKLKLETLGVSEEEVSFMLFQKLESKKCEFCKYLKNTCICLGKGYIGRRAFFEIG